MSSHVTVMFDFDCVPAAVHLWEDQPVILYGCKDAEVLAKYVNQIKAWSRSMLVSH